MSFQRQNWSQIAGSASQPVRTLQDGSLIGAPSHFTYISNTDALSTISGAGYFNDVSFEIALGDCLHVVGADEGQMFYVSNPSTPVTLVAMTGGGGQPFNWQVITTDTQMAVNNGYIVEGAGRKTLTLPVLADVGDTIRITNFTNAWTVAQNAGQSIILGSDTTATGAGGSLASTSVGDSIEIICVTANINWIVQHAVGDITVV